MRSKWKWTPKRLYFERLTKRGIPPPNKNLDKKGDSFSPTATSMFPVKLTPNQNLQRLTCSLDSQPSSFFFFFLECIRSGWTRVIKSGVWLSTPFWNACARVYPAVSTKFEKYPLLARCDLVCPGLAQKHRPLVTVPARDYWHDEKTTSIVKTTNGPDLLKRDQHTSTSSAIPQGLVWWLLHTMMRHDESIQVVFYSCVFQSKHRLVPLVGGLLRPHFPHDTTNDASFTTTRQPPPVCSREPLKGTCFAREIHRIIRHHGELAQQ